jgi:uncharacterized membrane protein YeaQ/YmgE (transglycosylase-associated protein family)
MSFATWIGLGLLVGALAKFIMPGKDPGGLLVTILIGIVGAVLGGAIARRLGGGPVTGFDLRSVAIATGGAILLLIGYRIISKRR